MKLKYPHLQKTLGTIIQENYWSFYPSEPFRMLHFEVRYPVVYLYNGAKNFFSLFLYNLIQSLYTLNFKVGCIQSCLCCTTAEFVLQSHQPYKDTAD